MMSYKLKVESLNNQEFLPKRSTEYSVGLDVFSNETIIIEPKKIEMVGLGFRMEFADCSLWAMLCARSSLQKKGLMLANSVGIIDWDYRGEVKMALYNFSSKDAIVNRGEKIGQLIVLPNYPITVCQEPVSLDTKRGEGGFGSTGL